MRQKFFWLDLAVCSLWMLIVLAHFSWWFFPTHFLVVVAVVMRMVLSFALYRREKRSWMPLVAFSALFVLLSFVEQIKYATGHLADLPFFVLGLNKYELTRNILICILQAWLFLGPIAVYIVERCMKRLTASTLTWKDALGAMMWKDKGTRTYCQLMLIAICALYAGLAMDMRMSRFACVVLPPLSLYLIAHHVSAGKGSSEARPLAFHVGLMVAAMVLFFLAQQYAWIWRIPMLVASIAVVAYACWQALGRQGLIGGSLVATIYLGILLPTLAIGYNQYVCLDYGRSGYYTLEPFRGIFFIKDAKTDKVGLRDRYGMLIEPAYEKIVHHASSRSWCIYELRNNGSYTLYNLGSNKMLKSNVGDQQLQDNICQLLSEFCDQNDYGHRDKLEVRVTSKDNAKLPLAHVKMAKYGEDPYYDYQDRPYIMADSLSLCSGEFATDTITRYGNTGHTLHFSYNVTRDSTVLYNIDVKTSRYCVPKKRGLVELAKEIEALLKK